MTDFFADDECCSPRFHEAMSKGEITGDVWSCEECGCHWKATAINANIREWTCQDVPFTLIRMQG